MSRSESMKRLPVVAVLVAALALSACVHSGRVGLQPDEAAQKQSAQPVQQRETLSLVEDASSPFTPTLVAVPARSAEQQESLAHPVFSVNSVPSWGSESAPDNGSMGLWTYNYYITHWWTPEGQAVLAMQPGQAFSIDGNTYLVEGVFDIDRSLTLTDVYARVGSGWIFVQTCIPNTNPPFVRVVYAR